MILGSQTVAGDRCSTHTRRGGGGGGVKNTTCPFRCLLQETSFGVSEIGRFLVSVDTTVQLGGWPSVRIILLMAFFVTSRHPCLFIST